MCHLKHNTNYMITEGEWEEKVKLPLVFYTLLTVDKSCTFPQQHYCFFKTYLICAV